MSIDISAPTPEPRTGPGRAWWIGEVVAAGVLGALSMIAGALVALIWRHVAPIVQGVVSVSGGQRSAYYQNPETKGFVGQDGTYGICAVLAGALLAVVAFVWFRKRGPIGAALALGGAGIGAAYFAAWYGVWLGPGHGSIAASAQNVPNNGTFDLPIQLSATGVIWLWPAAAVGLYFLLMLVFGPNDPEPHPAEERPGFPQWADPVDLTSPAPGQAAPGPVASGGAPTGGSPDASGTSGGSGGSNGWSAPDGSGGSADSGGSGDSGAEEGPDGHGDGDSDSGSGGSGDDVENGADHAADKPLR